MSRFGDHTPKDDLFNWIDLVKSDHSLTVKQIVILLAELIVYFLESDEND